MTMKTRLPKVALAKYLLHVVFEAEDTALQEKIDTYLEDMGIRMVKVDRHLLIHSKTENHNPFKTSVVVGSPVRQPKEGYLDEGLQIVKIKEDLDLTKIRIKGFINNLISLCKTELDVEHCFKEIFPEYLVKCNEMFDTNFMSPKQPQKMQLTLTLDEFTHYRYKTVMEQFSKEYARYKFIKQVLKL